MSGSVGKGCPTYKRSSIQCLLLHAWLIQCQDFSASVLLLTLGAHAPQGYGSHSVFVFVTRLAATYLISVSLVGHFCDRLTFLFPIVFSFQRYVRPDKTVISH